MSALLNPEIVGFYLGPFWVLRDCVHLGETTASVYSSDGRAMARGAESDVWHRTRYLEPRYDTMSEYQRSVQPLGQRAPREGIIFSNYLIYFSQLVVPPYRLC